MSRQVRAPRILCVVVAALAVLACGGEETAQGRHPILGDHGEAFVDAGGGVKADVPDALVGRVETAAAALAGEGGPAKLTVDYPLTGSVFPPEFVPPTFLWHEEAPAADTWFVSIDFADAAPLRILVPGDPPPKGEIDREAIGPSNALYEGTEYQNSAKAWTPTGPLWEEIKRRSVEAAATVTFTGFSSKDAAKPLSRGTVSILTSKDPVGAPIFYRDVPLMPGIGRTGKIMPLGEKAIPIIAWRLRDVSMPESKLVLKGMASCGNCHSFSKDGRTLGMDVDGPDGDKGMYAIKPLSKETVIEAGDVITWNSFRDKPKGHRTIGFMSRVSPDGRHVASTLNEALYVSNFMQFEFLQVFFPTRGILAYYSRPADVIRALPGADDQEFVHCSPAWTPDGEQIVFSRARAFDPWKPGQVIAKYPNDPNEPQVQYDLYRIPFNGGKGGVPVPIEGASNNGMSNTFPKVSPDGKWIVWTKCKNGLLMRPDSRLWIVPFEGGEAREMRCNTPLMNSWHSFSPNGRWLVFSSKSNTPYTQAFLTHIDENGNDSPAILVPNCTAANRAVNLPEFLNAGVGDLDLIRVPVVKHHSFAMTGERQIRAGETEAAIDSYRKALEMDPSFVRALVNLGYALMQINRHDRALLYLERAAREDPRNLFALYNLELCYLETGRPYLAKRTLERLVSIAPEYPGAHADQLRAAADISTLTLEIAKAEVTQKQEPNDPVLQMMLAELLRRAGRLEDCLRHMERAHELVPEDPRIPARIAWMLATNPDDKIRDGTRAVALAERAVELSKGIRPEPLDIAAAAYAEAGDWKKAMEAAEQAIKLAKALVPPLAPEIEERKALIEKKQVIRTGSDR